MTLEESIPELTQHPDHHVMLAALYQQSGRFKDAAAVYASLIAFDDSVGNWWAGLGIAFNAKPIVQRQAQASINQSDLRLILYFLGINGIDLQELDEMSGGGRVQPWPSG